MKTIIRISLLAVTAASFCACVKELTFHRDDIRPQLTVNAQMIVGDTLHTVYLSISKDERIAKINSGSVKCYVNGDFVADGTLDTRDDKLFIKEDHHQSAYHYDGQDYVLNTAGKTKQTRYSFKADFKPGDVVRIEAEADGGAYKAYSEIIVPKAPVISSVDTLRQNKPGYNFSYLYKIRLKGKDIIGEDNFYRIITGRSIIDKMTSYATEDEEARTWEDRQGFQYIELDKGNDPILNDGAPAEELDLAGASENTFRVFSDKQFADGTFNIGFYLDDDDILSRPQGVLNFNRMDSETTLSVIVYGITKEEYHYLKALSVYIYQDGDTSMTEPVSFPDNVEGGVGLVSICTPAVANVKFYRTYYENGGKPL